MADDARRNRIPPLVWIVLGLLALLAAIAWLQADGATRAPDTAVTMPVDLPDTPAVPDPAPLPPVTPSPR